MLLQQTGRIICYFAPSRRAAVCTNICPLQLAILVKEKVWMTHKAFCGCALPKSKSFLPLLTWLWHQAACAFWCHSSLPHIRLALPHSQALLFSGSTVLTTPVMNRWEEGAAVRDGRERRHEMTLQKVQTMAAWETSSNWNSAENTLKAHSTC